MALHDDLYDEASRILCELDVYETASVVVCLALGLNQAWLEICEADGVPFDEFAPRFGLWLAAQ